MTTHGETWLLWLQKISPLGPTNIGPRYMSELAMALSMAAPGGPVGFECVDECRCDERAVHMLHQSMMDMEHPSSTRTEALPQLLKDLREAIRRDHVLHDTRLTITDELLRDLASWRVIVSRHTGRVAYARLLYPSTWAVIEATAR